MAKKPNKRYPKCILCDTLHSEYEYSEYVDFCECNGVKPAEDDSYEFLSWCREEQLREWEDLHLNLKHSKNNDTTVIITGGVGTWQGRKDIYPVVMYDIASALEKCLGSCDDIKVELEDGLIHVYAYHHDGTNCFTISKFSKKGLKALENAEIYDNVLYSEPKNYWFAKFTGYLF